jgi:hypothetical protein
MIYDTFLFNGEMELLEIRLHELSGVVDRFVILEGTHTFTGHRKELFYRGQFPEFQDRIHHVVVSDFPDGDAWGREYHQRHSVEKALTDARNDDVLLIGDVDEIPRRELVAKIGKVEEPIIMMMTPYQYFLNCEAKAPMIAATRIVSVGVMRKVGGASVVRRAGGYKLENSGWHFSWAGGADAMRYKLASFSHQEYNHPELHWPGHMERIREKVLELDGSNRGRGFRITSPDEWPDYLRENKEKFQHMLKDV